MPQPKGYVDSSYLKQTGQLLNAVKARSYALMQIHPNDRLLDVGCGPGIDTVALAGLVGQAGQIAGVDYDLQMVAAANQYAEQAGVSAWVSHQRANATNLPFAGEYFNACRSERLFQHLPAPDLALAEMIRVTRQNGWIVVLDTDWTTWSIDSVKPAIERKLARFLVDDFLNQGYAGRMLYRLLKQKLADVVYEVFPLTSTDLTFARQILQLDRLEQAAVNAGVMTEQERLDWRTGLEQADAAGGHFSSVNLILCAGRKI